MTTRVLLNGLAFGESGRWHEGRFWFASLPEGQYSVRASDGSRVSEWRQGVWVAPGEQTNIVLHLRSKK